MIRTIIIDDEPLARNRLRKLLASFDDLEVIDEAAGGAEAIAKIEAHGPDLILLDVQMPDLDGFGVLRMIEGDALPAVIFVTAHDRYAVEAFEVSAIDYLLKPVRRNRLDQAISRAREKLRKTAAPDRDLTRLLESVAARSKSYLQRLPVRAQGRILILSIEQITSFRIDKGLVYVTAAGGEYWTRYTTFGQLEDQLDPNTFLRVHRQAMVNLNHIREVAAYDNSTARLTLSCGRQVSVSRNHMKRLRQALDL
ncbi:MAG TPA: response regulator, partial [Blastocatellia bacterium]|nr:response regulator [Blastocatellia bacterium]